MPSLEELLAQGDVKQISDEASRRLSKNPQDTEAQLALAKMALLEGDHPRVTTLLQQAAARADKQEVAMLRAALSTQRKDWKKAREIYQSLISQEPVRPGALFGLGVCLLELEQYEEARGMFERLVEQAPFNPSYHFELSRTYMLLGRIRDAVRHLVRCLRLDNTEDRAWYMLVNIVASQNRPRRATELLLLGLYLVPTSSLLSVLLKPDDAPSETPSPAEPAKGLPAKPRGLPMGRGAAPIKAALPEDIHSDAYHVALVQQLTALIQHGQGREALKRVREVQEKGVRTLGLKLMEGWACEILVPPDTEGALRVYEEAVAAFPTNWLPRNALGQFLQQQGQRYAKETVQAFEEAVRLAPEEAEPRFNLAQAYYNDKRFAEGSAVAQRLVDEVKDSNPVVHGHASRLLERFKVKLDANKSPAK